MHWLLEKPIAHRGLHDLKEGAPENTLPAFERAAGMGIPIELDVQLLRDGRVAVFHDQTLERLTGAQGRFSERTWPEVRRLEILGSGASVPLLSQVLERISGRVALLIEIKAWENRVGRLEQAVLEVLSGYCGLFALQSFNPFTLKWLAGQAPGVLRGQVSGTFQDNPDIPPLRKWVLKNLLLLPLSRPHFLVYDIRALRSVPVRVFRGRKPLIGWVAKSQAQWRAARPLCDNIIFEGFVPQDEGARQHA